MTVRLHFGLSPPCTSKLFVSTKAFALLDLSELFSVRNSVQRTTNIKNKYMKIFILSLSKSSFLFLNLLKGHVSMLLWSFKFVWKTKSSPSLKRKPSKSFIFQKIVLKFDRPEAGPPIHPLPYLSKSTLKNENKDVKMKRTLKP